MMIHRTIDIGDWTLDVLFLPDSYDVEDVLDYMYDMEASYATMAEAKKLMESGSDNTGFLFANPQNMKALLCVGPSSSGSEFLDSVVHEVHHFAVSVAEEMGKDLAGEFPAYVAGDTIRELADIVCVLGCKSC